jgi:SNF2 family DNA or RNA helicase
MRPGAIREIQEKISDIVLYRSNDELDLPPLTKNNIVVSLPRRARETYDTLKEQFATEEITAVNAGVLVGKLRQVATGAVYDDDGDVLEIHQEKLAALSELIEELQGSPLLVFYQYRHDLWRMRDVYDAPSLGGETSAKAASGIIEQWNNDELPVLYLHPASAGHGVNLQGGSCRTACWFNITWDYEHYQQAIARIHRQGQSSHIVLHHIVARDTIDGRILEALRGKATLQQLLLEHLRGGKDV